MLLLCIITFLVSLLTILFFHSSLRHLFKCGSKLPPGSYGWLPILGNTLSFIAPHPASSLGPFLNKSIERYGRIFKAHLFGHPTIVSCDAEFNSYILQNENRLFHAGYSGSFSALFGEKSILTVTGDTHKRLRGYLQTFASLIKDPNSSFFFNIEDNVLRVIDSWKDQKTVEFVAEAKKIAYGVIVKQTLGLEIEDPDAVEILENYKTFMKGLASLPIRLSGSTYTKAIQARQQIEKKVKQLQIRKQHDNRERSNGTMDLLDVLLSDQENISDEERSSLVFGIIFGGYETASMLIAIIAKFIGEKSNSKILNELREEHLSVMQNKNENGRLGWDDFKKMKFTQCVISEALRIGNVVLFVQRKTIKTVQYKGYEIPAGWKVFPILSSTHLDPSVHPDPFKFDPYRWQNIDAATSNFVPFSGGRRFCPGAELGRLQASFFIHHLVLRYSWTPLMDSGWPMRYPHLAFKHGLQVAIEPLSPTS